MSGRPPSETSCKVTRRTRGSSVVSVSVWAWSSGWPRVTAVRSAATPSPNGERGLPSSFRPATRGPLHEAPPAPGAVLRGPAGGGRRGGRGHGVLVQAPPAGRGQAHGRRPGRGGGPRQRLPRREGRAADPRRRPGAGRLGHGPAH